MRSALMPLAVVLCLPMLLPAPAASQTPPDCCGKTKDAFEKKVYETWRGYWESAYAKAAVPLSGAGDLIGEWTGSLSLAPGSYSFALDPRVMLTVKAPQDAPVGSIDVTVTYATLKESTLRLNFFDLDHLKLPLLVESAAGVAVGYDKRFCLRRSADGSLLMSLSNPLFGHIMGYAVLSAARVPESAVSKIMEGPVAQGLAAVGHMAER